MYAILIFVSFITGFFTAALLATGKISDLEEQNYKEQLRKKGETNE